MSSSAAPGWRRLRWWPAVLVLPAAVAGLLCVWVLGDLDRGQGQVVQTLRVVVVPGLLLVMRTHQEAIARRLPLAGGELRVASAGASSGGG